MPTRFWEISIGCLIFLGFNNKNKFIKSLKNFPSIICLLAIAIIMVIPIPLIGFSHILVVYAGSWSKWGLSP